MSKKTVNRHHFIFIPLQLIAGSLFIMALSFPYQPALALADIVFDPTNYLKNVITAGNSSTSLLNQGRQIQQQIKVLQWQRQNTGSVNNYQWRSIVSLIQQLDQLTRQGKALSYASANRDAQFRRQYPNYTNSSNGRTNYSQAYRTWNASTLDTLRSTLDATGRSANDFQSEQAQLNQLERQGKSARGRMQVLQVSSEIAAQNVNQLQELKRITLAQTNAQNSYMAYQVSKDSYQEKSLSELEKKVSTQFPKYKNNPKFGELQTRK